MPTGKRNLVRNETDYPDTEVKRLVLDTLRDADVRGVCVTVKHRNDEWCSGRYYDFWYPSKGQDRERILVRIPRPGVEIGDYHPYERLHGDCPVFELRDWQDAIVAIVAHEAHHHWQYQNQPVRWRNGQRVRVVGKEAGCDMAAYRAVQRRQK